MLFESVAVIELNSSLKELCSIRALMFILKMLTGSLNVSVSSPVFISMRVTSVNIGGVVSAVKLLTGAGSLICLARLGCPKRSVTTAA